MSPTTVNRRSFLKTTFGAAFAIALPRSVGQSVRQLEKPVRLGLITDLHQDIMHDGLSRMRTFVEAMQTNRPDAVVQLGDFAYPKADNREVIDLFNMAHDRSLHVIGNHDTDAGHTKQQCFDVWGMPGRYYMENVGGINLIVLDGNDAGSPTHGGGYPSYVGEKQRDWLKDRLASLDGPAIVLSHQPLAGSAAVDNSGEMQDVLGSASDRVLLAINGHSHIDDVLRRQGVTYMHLNSASYQWVGGDFAHNSYSDSIHEDYPWIASTCPYRDSLFATLTVDPESLTITIEGRSSGWVGPSPAALGAEIEPSLTDGEEIAPRIRDRRIVRLKH